MYSFRNTISPERDECFPEVTIWTARGGVFATTWQNRTSKPEAGTFRIMVKRSLSEEFFLPSRFVPASIVFIFPFAASAAANDPYVNSVQPFLAQSCYGCHNAKLKTADLNLE